MIPEPPTYWHRRASALHARDRARDAWSEAANTEDPIEARRAWNRASDLAEKATNVAALAGLTTGLAWFIWLDFTRAQDLRAGDAIHRASLVGKSPGFCELHFGSGERVGRQLCLFAHRFFIATLLAWLVFVILGGWSTWWVFLLGLVVHVVAFELIEVVRFRLMHAGHKRWAAARATPP